MDLSPLPQAEAVSLNEVKNAKMMKKLHQKIKDNLEKKTHQYEKQANKGRKKVTHEARTVSTREEFQACTKGIWTFQSAREDQ